jgi:hypothetical protein
MLPDVYSKQQNLSGKTSRPLFRWTATMYRRFKNSSSQLLGLIQKLRRVRDTKIAVAGLGFIGAR